MKKIILGFTGQMASGKGTAASYYRDNHSASTYTFSDMLKDALKRFHLEINRDHLIKVSEFVRNTFGEDTMARTMSLDVADDTHSLIIVEGIRREADIAYLHEMPGFVLVRIEADMETRYERLIARDEKADDSSKTFESFVADHERSTERSIMNIERQATEVIDNNGDLANLRAQLESLLHKYSNS
jgi:dephospho-CoA kinase